MDYFIGALKKYADDWLKTNKPTREQFLKQAGTD